MESFDSTKKSLYEILAVPVRLVQDDELKTP